MCVCVCVCVCLYVTDYGGVSKLMYVSGCICLSVCLSVCTCVQVPMRKEDEKMEYKYVKLDKDSTVTEWEEIPNRYFFSKKSGGGNGHCFYFAFVLGHEDV